MRLGEKPKTYVIPKNMASKDKVWSNGNLYLTWIDIGQLVISLLFSMLISLFDMGIAAKLCTLFLVLGLGLSLSFIKPLGYSFWYFIGLVILFYLGNKQWLWQRGTHN